MVPSEVSVAFEATDEQSRAQPVGRGGAVGVNLGYSHVGYTHSDHLLAEALIVLI
jgi:hypothetical protein